MLPANEHPTQRSWTPTSALPSESYWCRVLWYPLASIELVCAFVNMRSGEWMEESGDADRRGDRCRSTEAMTALPAITSFHYRKELEAGTQFGPHVPTFREPGARTGDNELRGSAWVTRSPPPPHRPEKELSGARSFSCVSQPMMDASHKPHTNNPAPACLSPRPMYYCCVPGM